MKIKLKKCFLIAKIIRILGTFPTYSSTLQKVNFLMDKRIETIKNEKQTEKTVRSEHLQSSNGPCNTTLYTLIYRSTIHAFVIFSILTQRLLYIVTRVRNTKTKCQRNHICQRSSVNTTLNNDWCRCFLVLFFKLLFLLSKC